MSARFPSWVLAAALAAAATPALGADPALDARVRQTQDRTPGAADAEAALVTGSSDLILLAPRKLFTVRLSVTPQWTNNAQLAPTGGRHDDILTGEAALGLSTRVADRVNIHAEAGIVSARYHRDGSLDYDALTADIGGDADWATPFGRLTLAAAYVPSIIYTRGFGEKQLTQHRLYASAQVVTPLPAITGPRGPIGRLALVSSGVVDRTWADPQDYDNWGASIDETLVFAPRPDLQVSVGAGLYRRDYDDYFPGLVGVKRKDHGYRASAAITYAPRPWLSLSLRYSRTDNHSTSDVNPYTVDDGGLSIRLASRF